ncbi:hypothetical protein KY285_010037 [Solanum tuberosum]|nr:hypothetical protein KY285_010037 [Solanum tuberosum]
MEKSHVKDMMKALGFATNPQSLIQNQGLNTATEAARFVFSSSETLPSSTSQKLKVDEHGRISEKQPLKKVKSSFRRIPRSRSNPNVSRVDRMTERRIIEQKRVSSRHFFCSIFNVA